jgi:hypothetical protein
MNTLIGVHVLVDLENVCNTTDVSASGYLDQVLKMLPVVLRAQGYTAVSGTVFAAKKKNKTPPFEVQRYWTTYFASLPLKWRMIWTTMIADVALIQVARRKLSCGELSPAVLLISGDGDFVPLVKEIRSNGVSVLVTAERMSRLLRLESDLCLDWREFGCGSFQLPKRYATPSPAFTNNIPFP